MKKKFCFRKACTFFLILMSVQVSAGNSKSGSRTVTEQYQQKKLPGR